MCSFITLSQMNGTILIKLPYVTSVIHKIQGQIFDSFTKCYVGTQVGKFIIHDNLIQMMFKSLYLFFFILFDVL